jgi:hypothetical protein
MTAELKRQLDELTALAREDPAAAHRQAPQHGDDAGLHVQQDLGDDADVQARLAALMLGAALAALDDYEALVRSRITEPAPAAPGDLETDRRRWLGIAIGKLETARYILTEAALESESGTRRWVVAREAARLSYTTMQDLIVRASGINSDRGRFTAAASLIVTLWGHPSGALEDQALRQLARERLEAGDSD